MFSRALVGAQPDHLDALASELEAEAARLRNAAADARARARDAESARLRRADAKREFLRLGARCSVLTRRGDARTALLEVADRYAVTLEVVREAARLWKAERDARALKARDIAVWKARVAGSQSREIAARFKITTRRVRQIVEAQERAHRSSHTALFRST